MLAGVTLLGTAGVRYLFACDTRRQEQAVLDRGWAEMARRATRRFPPALPGGRPAPAPLRGMLVILSLLAGGGILCIGGLTLAMLPPRTSQGLSPQKPD